MDWLPICLTCCRSWQKHWSDRQGISLECGCSSGPCKAMSGLVSVERQSAALIFLCLVAALLPGRLPAAGMELRGRAQLGGIVNDNSSDNVFPSGFLSFDEGFNLNRIDLIAEKRIVTNVKPRIGPFPGSKPAQADWGFRTDLRYGTDAAITYGVDDDLHINRNQDRLWLLPQWYLQAYLPWGAGASIILGSWFTPLGNEIGAPVDPPTSFYTHSYAFVYQPVKHVGAMGAVNLPVAPETGLWSLGLGLVQGWNNLRDNNDDKTLLFDLRWRSRDFKTWIDLENIVGYEQSEQGVTGQTRPFNAVSTGGEELIRSMHSLTFRHQLDERRHFVLNAVYGYQEGGDLVADANNPPGFLIVEDSRWYGLNLNYTHKIRNDSQLGFRAEWFKDESGAHALLPAGDYYGITANLSWWPYKQLRLRPEVRYDRYSGRGYPFGGSVPAIFFGEEKEQWLFSIDLTWFFDIPI